MAIMTRDNGTQHILPEILAPAGDEECFLAALSAGADAIYLGLKHFSARMEADNFGVAQLGRLTELAHGQQCKVYVAMNSIIKPRETSQAYRLAIRLANQVPVDGLIVQDIAMLDIARQAGFSGSIAISTLANATSPQDLLEAKALGANRVIVPRELSIDEIRLLGENCPPNLDLECFVQGALCYCVSGRCYWSSILGGRSGLRGRCVQPCRRIYAKANRDSKHIPDKRSKSGKRFFACQDLELAEVAHLLLSVPNLAAWKIEGRKKGPHYVYHTVAAYRLIRDNPEDPRARKTASEILELALGRPGVKGRFLPQNKKQPMAADGQTSSGRLAGKTGVSTKGSVIVKPHFELLPKDLLRIGVQDERWHATLPVSRHIPKGGSLTLKLPAHKTPPTGTPVYLVDRREPELAEMLANWRSRLESIPQKHLDDIQVEMSLPQSKNTPKRKLLHDMIVSRNGNLKRQEHKLGLVKPISAVWLKSRGIDMPRSLYGKTCFWLPPVIWPAESGSFQKTIFRLIHMGATHFVCNSPWQRAFFPKQLSKDINLTAGPFCNITNNAAIAMLERAGFSAAFASPELPAQDMFALSSQSPLPLGIVAGGFWPVGISRFGLEGIDAGKPFFSPKGECFWTRDHGGTVWLYPAWRLDLSEKRKELEKAGYAFFAWLEEDPPALPAGGRKQGLFNWDLALL